MKRIAKIATGVLAAGGAVAAASYGVCVLIDELLFNKKMIPPTEINRKISGCDAAHLGEVLDNNLEWIENYGYEKHFIYSDRGEKLTGFLLRTKTPSDTYVFAAHGYRSYGKKEFSGVCRFYLDRGINVFFPDHIASGESEGQYCTFGHYETLDSLKWLSYMKSTFGYGIKLILHGVSMGSAIVMMLSGRDDLPENVKGIVADCGFTRATQLFADKLTLMGVPHKTLIKAMCVVNKHHMGFDFEKLAPVESVANAKVPMMFIHGNQDKLVPCYMARELYDACASEKKELLIVDGADHAQSWFTDYDNYVEAVGGFLDYCLKDINQTCLKG